MPQKNDPVTVTEVQIWPVRNPEVSRVKAMASITFNGMLRVSGCRIIEGAKGLFVAYPSEKKPGSEQYCTLCMVLSRVEAQAIEDKVLDKFNSLTKA